MIQISAQYLLPKLSQVDDSRDDLLGDQSLFLTNEIIVPDSEFK